MGVLKLWISGFLLPWAAGTYLIARDRRTLLVIGPCMSVMAFLIDTLGTYLGFWTLHPVPDAISTLPFDVGMYPVLASFMIHLVRRLNCSSYVLVAAFALGTTGLEYIALQLGWVIYGRWWNEWWTFCSYLLPYLGALLYERWISKLCPEPGHLI